MNNQWGDIISGWLIQLLLFMAVVGLFGYELLAIAIPTLTLDGAAEQIADAAADAYGRDQDLDAATEAAEREAASRDATVVDVTADEQVVVVTVTRPTNTVIVHRIPGLDGMADVARTTRSRWGL